jgi:dUTPase
MKKLLFYKIDKTGMGLTKTHPLDVAYDIHAKETTHITPGKVFKINTNVKIKIPTGTYARIAERSSLASKGISVGGGVIDPNYTGEIICLMSCLDEYTIVSGDKIAQLILEKALICPLEEITTPPSPIDNRGECGFGSTGK